MVKKRQELLSKQIKELNKIILFKNKEEKEGIETFFKNQNELIVEKWTGLITKMIADQIIIKSKELKNKTIEKK